MTRFRLSGPAQKDVANILAASLERWGQSGRSRYASLLAAAIRAVGGEVGARLSIGRSELLPDLRSFHIRHARKGRGVRTPVHVIYYRSVKPDLIEIVRVLHERMDPNQHCQPDASGR